MFSILTMPKREYPIANLFNKKYKENKYILDKYKDDFIYYEETSIDEIMFDDKHSMPWQYFIINMTFDEAIRKLIFSVS